MKVKVELPKSKKIVNKYAQDSYDYLEYCGQKYLLVTINGSLYVRQDNDICKKLKYWMGEKNVQSN